MGGHGWSSLTPPRSRHFQLTVRRRHALWQAQGFNVERSIFFFLDEKDVTLYAIAILNDL